jgi:hypothetical protein
MIDQEINSRVDAYRGNPEALQQKYAVSQQLIDLLALQKIKSEMDAKSRDMQLKMAQTGKKPPIAQQLQQEVVGRTKQEMQKQLAGTMQQEAMEKQKALQQAVQSQEQGVAGLPAGNMMPPKAMAAGGIIDFSDEPAPNYEEGMASGGIVAFKRGGNEELEANETEKRKRLIDRLFPAVIQAESRGKRFDKQGNVLTSSKGAEGAAQVMPRTSRDPGFGVRPARDNSHEENIRVGKEYLDAMLRKYKDVDVALAAYNWGPGNVNKWLAAGADPSKLPKETRNYIPKVKTYMAKQDKGLGDQLAEGVMSLFPSAQAAETQPRAATRAAPKAAAPAEDEAVYSPEGVYMYGPQPKPYQRTVKPGEKYEPNPILDILQGKPKLDVPPTPAPVVDPVRGGNNEERKSVPYPEGRTGTEVDPTAGQPVTDETVAKQLAATTQANNAPPPAPAPAPETVPAGLASIIPSEYKDLAAQQTKYLSGQLGLDPAAERTAREKDYYEKVGLPTEQALTKKTERQTKLEALDAERVKYDRENELTEALVNARGSSWQGGLGSFGRNAIGVERRNADLRRQFMEESNKAQDALADIGLGVKKDVNKEGLARLKEVEDARQKGSQQAGENIRQGMSSEAQRQTNIEQAKQTSLWRQAQLDVQNTRLKQQQEAKIESYRNSALELLRSDEDVLKELQKTINLSLMQNQQPPAALKQEFDARVKELNLKKQKIHDRANSLLYGSGGGTEGWGESRVVTPK